MSKSHDMYQKLTPIQVKAIHSMFRFYDLDLIGKITKPRAIKILNSLGIELYHTHSLNNLISIKELLLYVDDHLPEPDPPLQSELTTFLKLVAKPDVEPGGEASAAAYLNVIKPKNIMDFYESTDQPIPNSAAVVTQLMTSMLEWDDCNDVPTVTPQVLTRDLTKFAKKSNALREFS